MVTNATSLSRSGLSDWLIQRASAVVLAAYTLCLLGSFIAYPDMDYAQWRELFDSALMRIFSLISLLALCTHAWVGMWTIGTDYLTPSHLGNSATATRLVYQSICVLLIVVYFIWGVQILWGS